MPARSGEATVRTAGLQRAHVPISSRSYLRYGRGGYETAITMMSARMLMPSVTGSLCAMRLMTGTLNEDESPRLPVNAPATHVMYLTGRGWSRPNSVLSLATCSGEALGPSIICAVSPGIIENAAKVRNETTNSVAISSMNLSPAYLRFCLAFSDNLPASLLTRCLYYYTYRITGRHMAARLCLIYRLRLFYDFYL